MSTYDLGIYTNSYSFQQQLKWWGVRKENESNKKFFFFFIFILREGRCNINPNMDEMCHACSL